MKTSFSYKKPSYTLATGDYDRVRALWDGAISFGDSDFDLEVLRLPVDQIFKEMAMFQTYDASEMSLATYLVTKSQGNSPFKAIPVFPSKKFRHGDIYLPIDSDIKGVTDLKGKNVGVPEYQISAAVWLRGIFQDDYNIAPTDITWYTGGIDKPGRVEKVKLDLSEKFKVKPIKKTDTLIELLKVGKIDALIAPQAPKEFYAREPIIKRLFTDPISAEKAYYKKSNIFPIMHTVVIRNDIVAQSPELPKKLFNAYVAAKQICFGRYENRMASAVSSPWFDIQLDETRKIMGEDFWAYGLEENRHSLEVFIRYMREQGLIREDYKPKLEELFEPVY